jgi:hypothetical protein
MLQLYWGAAQCESMCEAVGLIPSTEKQKQETQVLLAQ